MRAYWTPLLLVAAGVMLPTMWVLNSIEPSPNKVEQPETSVPPWVLIPTMSMLLLGSAVSSELTARKQLALARAGQTAEGTIETVRKYWPSKKRVATWSFVAADGHRYEGRCMLSEIDAVVLQSGSEVTVVYDPVDPSNNRIESAFWAVEWE